MPEPTGTVADIPDAQLVERAVRNCRRQTMHGRKELRWGRVSERFALGSTYSIQLCRRFNLDPHEYV